MKKILALVLALSLLLLTAGCEKNQTSGSILKAWTGKFSEDKLIEAINEYKKNYDTIRIDDTYEAVTIETDFEVSACSVTRLSKTSKWSKDVELRGYIDLAVETNCDGNKVTVSTDWWRHSGEDSAVKGYTVWSYLVRVKDAEGVEHYYYFRVDYSAVA